MNNRMRILRKKLNLSQSEFGAKLGVSNTAISKLETGENQITDQMAKLICKTYDVNMIWLQSGQGEMFYSADSNITIIIDRIMHGENEFAKSVFKAFASLDDSEWKTVQKLIEAISSKKKNQT